MEILKRLYYKRLKKKNSMKDFAPSVKKSKRSFWGNVILGLFLLAMAVAFFFPVLYMVSQSLKPMNEMFIFPPKIMVQNPTFDNYRDFVNVLANTMVPVTRSLFNSLFVVVIGSIGHILLASLCAYPLAKYKFPGSKFFNQIIVYSLMFNASVTAIPNFLTIAGLGMLDTQWAIIVPGLASTLGLYLMKNFMEQIPDSLMEAAQIDGASSLKIFWFIVVKMSATTLLVVFLFSFVWNWNETYVTGTLLRGNIELLPSKLNMFNSEFSTMVSAQGGAFKLNKAYKMAATLISIMPLLLLYVFVQKQFIQGIENTGITGE